MLITFLLLVFYLDQMPVTRWAGPGEPISHRQWIETKNISENLFIGNLYMTDDDNRADSLLQIIVASDLYIEILSNLQITIADIESLGYSVHLDTVQSVQGINACIDMRNFLISKVPQGLVGVYFIGEVPIAWYQMIDDWGSGPEGYEMFPSDLYYMDLNGLWTDDSFFQSGLSLSPGSDSIFDGHTGDVSPEIFIGRLYFSPLGDEAELTNRYLRRAHMYRTDSLSSVHRGLSYVDDDWAYWASIYKSDMLQAYSEVTSVSLIDTTRPDNYIGKLDSTFEWVGLFCHSSPWLHTFKVNGGSSWSDLNVSELPDIAPAGLFYNMFACSNVRYVENGYMGGTYVIHTPKGLGCIGTTKTGSMLHFFNYYYPLGQGKTLGQAFLDWFVYIASGGFTMPEKSWHYGMTYIGDPVLLLQSAAPFLEISEIAIYDSAGNNDNRMDPGETIHLYFGVKNHYSAQASHNVSAELKTDDPDISFSSSTQSFGNINPGSTVYNTTPFELSVSSSADPHSVVFTLFITDNNTGKVFSDSFTTFIGRQQVLIIDDDGTNTTEQSCIQSLDNLQIGWEMLKRDNVSLTLSDLIPYQAVIWLTGLETDSTLTTVDQANLENYFNNGGNILLYGNNIAQDLDGTSFLQNFLKVQWIGRTYEHYQDGVNGDPVSDGLQIVTTSLGIKDVIQPLSGSSTSFFYRTSGDSSSMVRVEGSGKIIFACYSFHGISNTVPGYAIRDTVYSRILNYFNIATSVEEVVFPGENTNILQISCLQNQTGRISFLLKGNPDEFVEIKIYNILGSPIRTLYSGLLEQNRRFFYWNMTDDRGGNVSQGVYFIEANSSNDRTTGKFSVIR